MRLKGGHQRTVNLNWSRKIEGIHSLIFEKMCIEVIGECGKEKD